MIGRSKLARVAAAGTVRTAARAFVAYVRNVETLLFLIVERLYDAHTRRVQMRLAPTKWLD